MMTRADYMKETGKAAFHRYYGEIVLAIGLENIPQPFALDKVRAALARGDDALNSLPLAAWDSHVSLIRGASKVLKDRGDFLSLGTGVCILKEAARIRAESVAALQPGERLWNGATVTPELASAYNALQSRIESFRKAGRPVPVELLNGAHNLIASAK